MAQKKPYANNAHGLMFTYWLVWSIEQFFEKKKGDHSYKE